jgi:hypothetical protein
MNKKLEKFDEREYLLSLTGIIYQMLTDDKHFSDISNVENIENGKYCNKGIRGYHELFIDILAEIKGVSKTALKKFLKQGESPQLYVLINFLAWMIFDKDFRGFTNEYIKDRAAHFKKITTGHPEDKDESYNFIAMEFMLKEYIADELSEMVAIYELEKRERKEKNVKKKQTSKKSSKSFKNKNLFSNN